MNNQTNCCNALGKLKKIRICLIFILPWDSNSLGLIFDLLGQVFNSKQRVPKRFDTPYGFRNPYMLPSTDTYSWHFNVRCMQMDSLIFHSSNYIASRQARSAKVSWNVEFSKFYFPIRRHLAQTWHHVNFFKKEAGGLHWGSSQKTVLIQFSQELHYK